MTIIIATSNHQDQLLDEDSSYDSDNEVISPPHTNVSRNVSETLGQELCDDYNSVSIFFHSFIQFRHHQLRRVCIPDLSKC